MANLDVALVEALLDLVPADGTPIGNGRLRQQLGESMVREIAEPAYLAARDALIERGLLVKGQGRGGSVRRAEAAPGSLSLHAQEVPSEAKRPAPKQSGLPLSARKTGQPTKAARKGDEETKVLPYRHDQKRRNNPDVGVVTPETDPEQPRTTWVYDPHLDPALQFDVGRAQVEKLIDEALVSGDTDTMRAALETLRRMGEPYLNWAGKAERTSFEVDTVSLHVHERIDPATILAAIRKRMAPPSPPGRGAGGEGSGPASHQSDFFRAWFEDPLPYREAIEFYRHDRGWANRLIAGDSLLVMNSLLQKEGMAGQVQMIYIDPPYGIKYGSNFQPFVNKRDVKDRNDEDLTQEPEMIKAFRDTWELGIHSYLTYLRDRLLLAKELLHESGSVFVQISDENLHHTREMLDEVFGAKNFCCVIAFRKTTGANSPEARVKVLATTNDFIIWYARDSDALKYRQLYLEKDIGELRGYSQVENRTTGDTRKLTNHEISNPGEIDANLRIFQQENLTSTGHSDTLSQAFHLHGASYLPAAGNHWKTTQAGLRNLAIANRLTGSARTLNFRRHLEDFPVYPLTHVWQDIAVGFGSDAKAYVVQTSSQVVERCLLMTTDPGDLVLDPTCGSGTSAFVAEKWGRRWITCDTSRVAATLAKQRLMTASYDYFELKYPHEGIRGAFIYKAVPHVTLRAIANNPEIDQIWERLHPDVQTALGKLNADLREALPKPFVVRDGGRKGKVIDFRAPPGKTIRLPAGEAAPSGALLEWEVPFDFPSDWPASARSAFDAFHQARQVMRKRMDQSIAAHADQETLYDQPQVSRTKLRITGPFTVEAVPFPTVVSLDEQAPAQEADVSIARAGESSRQHGWRDELLKTGIRGKGGQMLKFAALETLPGTRYLHCSGTLAETGERVVVSFGPEHAALEQRQVELAMREAGELFPRPKMIVYCAFTFDPEAAKDIDATKGIVALKAQMNTDLLTEDLKKARSSNQSFWLMGQPDVDVRKLADGQYQVEVNGFDYFDLGKTAADGTKGDLVSGGKSRIAAWALDTDYDERSLFPRQVFFPMAGAKDGWNKLRRDIKAELDESLLEHLHGTVSLPFEAGENRKVAVKIVDDRGIESLKVIALD